MNLNPSKKLWFLFLSGVCVSGCIQLPESGRSAFLLTSPSYESQMGADGYKEVLAKSKIDRDPRRNEILRRVGTRIATASRQGGYSWEFTLIESKEQNAWCMPGGKVAVYTGILPAMMDEAGMATVLGHEVAHATQRHSGQRITQQMVVGLGLSVADIGLANSRHHDTLMGLMGAGATVGVILPYSRGHETEADEVGLRYMARAGYDPRNAVLFWQRFAASSGNAPPEWLSTHPGTSSRISDLKSRLPEAIRLYEASPDHWGAGVKLAM